jgi:hypothetical protein
MLLLGLRVHRADLFGFPPRRGGGGVDVIGAQEIGLSSCRKGHRAARASNRPMYLALHLLT